MSDELFGLSILKQLGLDAESQQSQEDPGVAILRELGMDSSAEAPKKEEGFDIFQPIRTAFGATGGIGGAIAGALAPDAYQRAKEELGTSLGVGEASPWYEKTEALPGLGDVLAQGVPTEIRESLVGRIGGPVARMVGNIAGDPTTYTPLVLGKAAGAVAKGVKAAAPIIEASEATVRGAEGMARAGQLIPEAVEALKARHALNTLEAVQKFGSPIQAKAYETLGFLRELDPVAQGSAAALAYGPKVLESAWESAKETVSADTLSEGLVSGANTILMAGLGVLMGKGLVSAVEAKSTLAKSAKRTLGIKEEAPRVEPPVPGVEQAERVGEVPGQEPAQVAPEAPRATEEVAPEEAAVQDMLAAREEARAIEDQARIKALQEAGATPVQAEQVLGESIPRIPEPTALVETAPEVTPVLEAPLARTEAAEPVVPDEVAARVLAERMAPEPGFVENPPPEVVAREMAPAPDVVLARQLAGEKKIAANVVAEEELGKALKGLTPEQAEMIRTRFGAIRPQLIEGIGDAPLSQFRRALRDQFRSEHGLRKQVLNEYPAQRQIPEVVVPEPVAAKAGAVKQSTQVSGKVIPARRVSPEVALAKGEEPVAARQLETTEGPGVAPKVEKERLWNVVPEDELPGVLERFSTAKKGTKFGPQDKWDFDPNKKWLDRFVQLHVKEGKPRDEAFKLLAQERKVAGVSPTGSVAAARNLIREMENTLADFYVREKGVTPPEKTRGASASTVADLKARKVEIEGRIPTAAEVQAEPAKMQAVLEDYHRLALDRKGLKGLNPRDQALWDTKLTKLAMDLGINVPKATNAEVKIEKLAKKLKLDLKAIKAARPEAKVTAPKAGAPEKVTVYFEHKVEGTRARPQTIWISPGGNRFKKFGEELHLEEKVPAPEKLVEDIRAALADPNVMDINLIEARMKAKDRAALDGALVSTEGKTLGTFIRDGIIRKVRKASAEVEEPRIEYAQARNAKPDTLLSRDEKVERDLHYSEDVQGGVDLGDGLRVADHDRKMGPEYAKRVAEETGEVARTLKGIAKELAEIHEEGVDFGGITTSPYLSGLYHDGKLYVNPVEAVHAANTRAQAVDNMLYTLFHEAAHSQGFGHDLLHGGYSKYLERLSKDEGRIEEYRKLLMEALPKETFERIQKELVPEFRKKLEEIHGESWRRVEGQSELPAGNAPGSAAARESGVVRGQAAAEGGNLAGAEPGGAVQRSGGGEARGVRSTSTTGGDAAQRAAEAEAVGPADRGEVGAEANRIEVLEARPGASGRGIDLDTAKRFLDEAVERGVKLKVPEHELLSDAWHIAGQARDGLTADELEKASKAIPDPGRGQEEALLNLLRLPGLSKEVKAQAKLWYDLTKGKWNRDKVEKWEEVGEAVQKFLGLDSPENLIQAIKKRGGGYTSKDVLLLRTIVNDFGNQIDQAKERYIEAAGDGKVGQEVREKLFKEWRDSEKRFQAAALTTADASTGVARALAIHKAELHLTDPELQWKTAVKAHLREKLRKVYPVAQEAEAKTEEVFGKLMDSFKENSDFGEFRRALDLIARKPTRLEKALEFYKAGLLGWPSEIANMGGNTLFRAARYVEDVTAGLLDAASSKLFGTERANYIGENSVSLLAMKRAMQEAGPGFFGDVTRLFQLKGLNPEALKASLKHGAIAEDMAQIAGGAIAGKKGHFVRFHLDMMGVADALSKHVSRTEYLYRQVYKKLVKNEFQLKEGESLTRGTERIVGEFKENYKNFTSGQAFDPVKLKTFEPLMKQAEEVAKRDTFQADLPGGLRGVQQILKQHPSFQFLIPFFRTPVNIAWETLRRTPFGLVGTIKNWEKMSQAERMSSLAPPVVGTAIMSLFAGIAATGNVTGGGPTNPEAQDALRAVGWQPYSIRLGDQWFSYQRLEPLASLMGFAADYVEAMKRGEGQTAGDLAEKMFASLSENLTNKTFLSSLTSFSAALSDPKRALGGFVKQLQGSVVPNSIGFVPFGHLARAVDPVYRQTDAFTAGPFLAKIPGVSSSLPPQYSPVGTERTRTGSAFERAFSPYQHQAQQSGPKAVGVDEIVRLNAVPKAPMKYWVSPQGIQVPLMPGERQQLAKAMDEAVLIVGSKLVKDPTYQRLPDNELDGRYRFGQKTKEDVVRKVMNRYRSQALDRIKGNLRGRAKQIYRERTA